MTDYFGWIIVTILIGVFAYFLFPHHDIILKDGKPYCTKCKKFITSEEK